MRARIWILGGEGKGSIWLSRIGRGMSKKALASAYDPRERTPIILIPHSVAWEYDHDQAGRKEAGERKHSTAQHSTPTATAWRCPASIGGGQGDYQHSPCPASQLVAHLQRMPAGPRLDTLEEDRAGMKMNAMN